MGSGGAMRKCMWAPKQNLSKFGWKTGLWMEVILPGAGCLGLMARCPGSGSVDELNELHMESGKSGKIWWILWKEIGKKMMKSYIYLQHMKSADQIQQNFITLRNHKKILGAIFVGNFEFRIKSTKLG